MDWKTKLKIKKGFENKSKVTIKRNLLIAEKNIQKEVIRRERLKIGYEHKKYLRWIKGAVVHHDWNKDLKLEYDRTAVTEEVIHKYIIHPGYFTREIQNAKTENIGLKYLFEDLI